MALRDFIPADQVKRGDVISSGGFGLVYEGRLLEKRSGRWLEVALKQLKPEVERVERDLKQFERELQETLEIARWCKHVVKCFGWTRVGFRQSPALVMKMYKQTLQELILKDDAGNLRDTDDPADRLAPALMLRIAKDVAHGLAELHNARISNEDLKPGNVLLDAENHAVLTDFGISKFFGSGSQETVQFSTLHIRGTSPFLPPEKLASDNARMTYSLAVDMWAFGILLGQMVTVDLLYPYGHGVTWVNVRNQLVRDRRAPTPPAVPELPRLQQLIHDCLQLDPAQRITAEQAIHELSSIEEELHTATGDVTRGRSSSNAEVEALRAELAAAKLREQEVERKHREEERKRREAQEKHKEAERKRQEAERKRVEEERKRREAEQKHKEAEQREAQLREQRFAAAHALAQTEAAATSPLRATKLRTSPACIATLHTPSYRTSQGNKQHTVSSVAFSRDGTMLVSGTADDEEPPGGFLELWDLASRGCMYVQNMCDKAITRVATSSDGCTIASIHDSIFCKKIQLWNFRCQDCQSLTAAGMCGGARYTCLCFSPNGATLASGHYESLRKGVIRIWNVAGKAKMVPEMQGELVEGTGFVSAVAFSRDGERLASGSTAKTVRVWDLRTNKCTACIESDSVVWSVVWSLDNVHVLFGCQDGMIRVCNIAKGVVRVLKGHSPRGQTYKETICNKVISPGVHSLVLTPNGKHAVSGASDNTIKIWDWHSGACMATLEDSEGVACVAVSPDGLMLASGTADKLIRLWRVAD